MRSLSTLTTSLAAFALFNVSAAVQAAPITVQFTGFTNGSSTGSIYGQRNVAVNAGEFSFDVLSDPAGLYWDDTLNAFCIDVTRNLITSGPVSYVIDDASSRFSASQLSLLGQLHDYHAASITNGTTSAAFQLAVWEILYDPASLSLSNGGFHSNAFGSARQTAQEWLNGLSADALGYVSSYEFFVLNPHAPQPNQALLVSRQVPEPGMLVMLSTALFGLALLRRRVGG